jgi:hypothetical protein
LDRGAGRYWIINALAAFLLILFIWLIAALWTASSAGGALFHSQELRSRLGADYAIDPLNLNLSTLRLAILGETFADQGYSSRNLATLRDSMLAPVPSATSQGSGQGAAQPTETPIPTNTATASSTPTQEITKERPRQSSTPRPTLTPKKSPTPTAVPTDTPYPAKTATPTPFIQVFPILECVEEVSEGLYRAYFGYKNKTGVQVEIPLGPENYFYPKPIDRGQPTIFEVGRSPSFPESPLSVEFNDLPIKWILAGKAVKASAISLPCELKNTPTPGPTPSDFQAPSISEGELMPPPGDLAVCSINVAVDGLRVVDEAPSSGIAWVKLKYNVEGTSLGYKYSEPMTLCAGGPTEEGGWDGTYCGSQQISILPEWELSTSTSFHINLWAKAYDHSGNSTCMFLGSYTMPAECGGGK